MDEHSADLQQKNGPISPFFYPIMSILSKYVHKKGVIKLYYIHKFGKNQGYEFES